jgi:hypothetical protein
MEMCGGGNGCWVKGIKGTDCEIDFRYTIAAGLDWVNTDRTSSRLCELKLSTKMIESNLFL